MKYLSDFIDAKQTKTFNKHGAFFAFSKAQLSEKQKPNEEYVSCGLGLVAPKATAKKLMRELRENYAQGIAEDIAETGIKAIIHRELSNHEAVVTMDISDTVDALEAYGITAEQVQAEWKDYFQSCIDNDLI